MENNDDPRWCRQTTPAVLENVNKIFHKKKVQSGWRKVTFRSRFKNIIKAKPSHKYSQQYCFPFCLLKINYLSGSKLSHQRILYVENTTGIN